MESFFSGLGVGSIVGLLVVVLLLFVMDLGTFAALKELGLLRPAKPLTLFGDEPSESKKQVAAERG